MVNGNIGISPPGYLSNQATFWNLISTMQKYHYISYSVIADFVANKDFHKTSNLFYALTMRGTYLIYWIYVFQRSKLKSLLKEELFILSRFKIILLPRKEQELITPALIFLFSTFYIVIHNS